MKVKSMLKMVAAVLLITSMAASNALAADGTGTATANVVVPLAITNTIDLNWGTFAPDPTTPGTVEVPAAQAGPFNSTIVSLLAQGSTGTMALTGDNNRNIITTMSANPHIFTGTNPANIMTGNLSVLSPTATDSLGGGTVYIGGVLDVGAGQPADVYSGNYTITVNYN